MTTLLIVATGATVELNDVKAAEAVALMATHGVKVGLTSMRGLLNGSLTKACGLEVVADEPIEILAAAQTAEAEVVEAAPVEEAPAKVEETPVKVKEAVINPNAAMTIDELLALGDDAEVDAGWGVYYCKPESLVAKRARLTRKLRKIAKSDKLADCKVAMVNGENSVDMLVFSRPDGSIVATVTPKKRWGTDMNTASVTTPDEVVVGSWKDVVAFFANPEPVAEAPEAEAEAPEAEAEVA